MQKLLIVAVLALTAAVMIGASFSMAALAANNHGHGSNKAFGQCVSNAAKTNSSKLVCNILKRGHPFTVHNETDNETG